MRLGKLRSKEDRGILFQNKQVFVVDDDASVCRALGVLLAAYGFAVNTFTCAEDFFSTVPNSVAGCVILDIHMPGLDGWKAQQRILKSDARRPVIFITADKLAGNSERALKAGAVGFLQKPFNDQALVNLINSVVGKKGWMKNQKSKKEVQGASS